MRAQVCTILNLAALVVLLPVERLVTLDATFTAFFQVCLKCWQ
jgi:hypothetical protein